MFGGMGIWEVLLIFIVALLLFGAKRLPEIGSSLGKGIREFKGSLREIENEMKIDDDPRPSERNVPKANTPEQEGPRRLRSDSGVQKAPPSDEESESREVVEEESGG